MNKSRLPALIGLIIALSGCKPKEEVTPLASQDLRTAGDVKNGSYFVYKDSASGAIDSFSCYYSRHGESAVSSGSNESLREQEDYKLNDGAGLPYRFRNFSAFNSALICEFGTVFQDGGFVHDTSYFVSLFRSPFPGKGNVTGNNYGQTEAIDNYPTYVIAGTSYQNVQEYSTTTSALLYPMPTYDTITMHTFYSVQSGLIKYCVTHHGNYQAWELVKSNLIR